GGTVVQGFRLADCCHGALNANLPVQTNPGEQQGGPCIFFKLPRLAAAVVCIENEPAVVEVLEQHGTDIRHLICTSGGQRHGIGFQNTCLAGILEPILELHYRVVIQLFPVQPFAFKVPTHIADVHTASPFAVTVKGSVTSGEDNGFSGRCQAWLTKAGPRGYAWW